MIRALRAHPIRVPESQDIGVNRWEIGTATLTTTSAMQCLILAAHNSRTLTGLVGHFTEIDPDHFSDPEGAIAFRSALKAIPRIGRLDATSIWVGGGDSHPEGMYYRYSEIDRAYALANLALLEATNLEVDWQTDGQLAAQLNCSTGILETHWGPI
ncbi:MAG TPA: hypothetical protein VLG92_05290 [Candidatus Saccharimonadia bacterium]|nr:hypothetical protein [Candidatus Saccharimonadia bacterium]